MKVQQRKARRPVATARPRATCLTLFSVLKVAEGGIGKAMARGLLAEHGITTLDAGEPPLIGYSSFYVLGGQRVVRRAERILWS